MPIKKPLIIAEIGHSWNGDLGLAKKMIWAVKECGADMAKFQLYDIDTIKKWWEMHYLDLKKSQLSREQLQIVFEECQKANIEFLASVFDPERVKWTEELKMKKYKIASRSIYNEDLIKAIEDTGKPIIASLGEWKGKEFPKIKGEVYYLFCISRRQVLEGGVDYFPERFDKYDGFSDHTVGIRYPKLALDRGAKIVEVHFTFDKNAEGCDQFFSIEPEELKELVDHAKEISQKMS